MKRVAHRARSPVKGMDVIQGGPLGFAGGRAKFDGGFVKAHIVYERGRRESLFV